MDKGHPLGRALFEDADMTRRDWVRTQPQGVVFTEKGDSERQWRSAATRLGITYEEYAHHRSRGEHWCSPGQHWTTAEHGCPEHYVSGRYGRRTKRVK